MISVESNRRVHEPGAFIRKCGYPKVKEDPLENWVGFSTNTTKFSSKCNQIKFGSHG